MINYEKIRTIADLIRSITKSKDIYLFGSYASGNANNNSDLDIAVIKDDISNEDDEIYQIRKRMLETEYVPMDLVFLERAKFQKRKNIFGNLYYEVANKGKKI